MTTEASARIPARREGSAEQPSRPIGLRPRLRRSIAVDKLLLDAVLLALAIVAARVSAMIADSEPVALPWSLALAAIVLVALSLGGVYRPRFSLHFLNDARSILGATAIAAMTVSFVRLLFAGSPEIAGQSARLWLFAAAYLIAGHGAFQLIQSSSRRLGAGGEPTLVIGAGVVGDFVARRLTERPEFGLRPVAFLDDAPIEGEARIDLPVLRVDASHGKGEATALADALTSVVEARGVRHVIVAFSLASHETELALLRRCSELGVSISLVPRLFEGVPDQTRLERIGGIPLISVYPADPRGWQFAVKYALDRIVAAVGILLLSPVLVLAALGTLATVGRPILFRQQRVGLDGRAFEMLKFRTMRGTPSEAGEADAEWAASIAGTDPQSATPSATEDRSTSFGNLLRRSGVDELPQLFNVLRGEMSLVGPRPERRAYVELFERSVRRYDDRHRVKAGITGWAQVHGLRGETSLTDRVEWDNYYIENWSPWLDLKILLLTITAVLRRPESQ
jgi:exopolysaccharide biosynthesis polyprenyl glycosylphosphotransferase